MIDVYELMEKYDDEYLQFDCVEYKPSNQPDLCAMILLDKLQPRLRCTGIIAGADSESICFSIDVDKLGEVATEDDIIYLIRCGVHVADEALCMFV
jgi:hypothetical protein